MHEDASSQRIRKSQERRNERTWYAFTYSPCPASWLSRSLESTLETELSTFTSAFHNHLIVYAGSPLSSSPFFKRQAADVPDRPILDFEGVDSYDNTTLPEGGILKRYQLLTPALISTLLVSFFILVPVLFFGLTALASVQNPVRSDVSKTFNAQERKNQ